MGVASTSRSGAGAAWRAAQPPKTTDLRRSGHVWGLVSVPAQPGVVRIESSLAGLLRDATPNEVVYADRARAHMMRSKAARANLGSWSTIAGPKQPSG